MCGAVNFKHFSFKFML